MGIKLKIKNGGAVWTDKTNVSEDVGDVPSVSGLSSKTDGGPGGFYRTTITLNDVSQTVVNGTEYQGTKIYDFPECRMYVIGAVATLRQKTTSTIASTLNSGVTGAIGVGTATASATTLATTMQDIIPTTAFTSSTTINVAGTAVTAVLASPAVFDGTATAKDLFLNTAYATTGDVDADATQTISGTIVVTWVNLGDK
jgi:hypothetical protein